MLHEYAINQLKDLVELLENLDNDEYTQPMEEVFESAIGKHTRHIIDFYQIFYKGYKKGILSYDDRKRKVTYEFDKNLAIEKLLQIQKKLSKIPDEKDLILKTKLNQQSYFMPTTVAREFLYLMEHTTHHIALIRIGLHNLNPAKNQLNDLGIAYSTPRG